MLRVGVIGCGWATRNLHAPGLRDSGAGVIAGVCDPNEAAMAWFRSAAKWTCWRRMLEELDCDAILIASPPEQHAEAAAAALHAGRHVLLEKPVAPDLEGALAIQQAAQQAGRVLAVGFNQRCHPGFLALRRRIASGKFGQLRSIRVRWSNGAGLSPRGWIGRRQCGGGALMDLGAHVVDLWRFLTGGELEALEADSVSSRIDDETATLRGRGPGGTSLFAELSLVGGDWYELAIEGSLGRARLKPYGRGFQRSYAAQWAAFAAAVRREAAPPATIEDGLASLKWIGKAAAGLPVAAATPPPPVEFPLTVICSTTTGYSALRTTVAHLRRQTIAREFELLLVGPDEASLAAPEQEVQGFAAVTRIAAGRVRSIGQANAAGVRAARGRIVALTEDHCFPEPGWAAALVRAHQGGCSAAGPVVRNANPRSRVSESDFVIGYGPWMEPVPGLAAQFLPGHNSSYKRDELLELGGRLEQFLESETVLHMAWSQQGRKLVVEPEAKVRHVNFSLWRSWIPVQFLAGRLFGGVRSAAWPLRRKLFYAAASPLIPAVRFWRCAREYFRPGRRPANLLRIAPVLAAGLMLDGAGQCLGYLLGPADAMARLSQYEFNRIEHVLPEERSLWL